MVACMYVLVRVYIPVHVTLYECYLNAWGVRCC